MKNDKNQLSLEKKPIDMFNSSTFYKYIEMIYYIKSFTPYCTLAECWETIVC